MVRDRRKIKVTVDSPDSDAKNRVRVYWLTGGTAAIIGAIAVVVAAMLNGGGSPSASSTNVASLGHSTPPVYTDPPSTEPTPTDSASTAPPSDGPSDGTGATTEPTWYTITLSTFYGGGADSGQVVVGGKLFSFVHSADPRYQGGGDSSSTCRSITVKAGIPDQYAKDAPSGSTLEVITDQGTANLHVPTHALVSKTVNLSAGGGFVFGVAGGVGLWWNATLSCSTPDGH